MNKIKNSLLLTLLLAVGAFAQTTANGGAQPSTPRTLLADPAPPKVVQPVEKPPVKPATTTPTLSESGKQAVDLSEKWKDGTLHGPAPVTIDRVGRVQFPFGESLPTVVCAPKGVCAIELEPGEMLRGDPHLGDSVRWHLELEYFGDATDGTQTPVFIVKPDFGGLDTDLIITTNRRAYIIRLASDEKRYMPQVSFIYPADEQKRIRDIRDQHAVPAAPLPPPASFASLFQVAPTTPEDKAAETRTAIASMDFSFSVSSNKQADRGCLRPRAVYEDKKAGSTFVQMQPCVNVRNLPVVLVKEGGDYVKTNYRYIDGSFVIDQLFDSAVLRSGGKRGDIKNEVHIDRVKEEARVR